ELGRRFTELAPGGDVDEVRALLVVALTVLVALVDGQAEAGHARAAGGVAQLGVAGEVADDHHLVERVDEPVLALGVDDGLLAAARAEVEDLDTVAVHIEPAAAMTFRRLPTAVLE